MRQVGIVGAAGLTGQELFRLLRAHPGVRVAFLHSRRHAGGKVGDVHPHLAGFSDLAYTDAAVETLAAGTDAIFLAVPHGEAKPYVAALAGYAGVVIDVSHDHRADAGFAYGLTELAAARVREARRIANPGCFATVAALSAAPLLDFAWSEPAVTFAAITGSSGAGVAPTPTTHHPFRDGNVFAYKLFAHQHEPEVTRALHGLGKGTPRINLLTHSGPFVRGIHCTTTVALQKEATAESLAAHFRSFYAGKPFVRVRETPPSLRDVVGSNFCDLHVAARGRDVAVVGVIDNLVKGAAGQAIQNLNLALGNNETEGLWNIPSFF